MLIQPYCMEEVKNKYDALKRPGGNEITDRALSVCMFPVDAKILDIGCGSGATVRYLKTKYNYNSFGIDINSEKEEKDENILKATAEDIPFETASMDGVIMECSYSLMHDQEKVLQECCRVLKTSGKLIISDMYAWGEAAHFAGCLGHLDTKDNIMAMLANHGFEVSFFEDFSFHLQTLWGQMIMEKGAASFYCGLQTDAETLKRVKCGYFLLVASKTNKP